MRLREKQRWEALTQHGYFTLTTEWQPYGWELRFKRYGSTVFTLYLDANQGRALAEALFSLDWDPSVEEDE